MNYSAEVFFITCRELHPLLSEGHVSVTCTEGFVKCISLLSLQRETVWLLYSSYLSFTHHQLLLINYQSLYFHRGSSQPVFYTLCLGGPAIPSLTCLFVTCLKSRAFFDYGLQPAKLPVARSCCLFDQHAFLRQCLWMFLFDLTAYQLPTVFLPVQLLCIK